MALINCPECNKSISDSALSCPRCGFRLNIKIKGIEKIIYNHRGENKNRENNKQVTVSNNFQSNYKSVNRKALLSSIIGGFTIAIIMWFCSNYIIYVPNIVFSVFSELQFPGKYISHRVIIILSRNDFQRVVDALEWFKYVEIFINGIIYSCVIYLVRFGVGRIRNIYQSNFN